MKYLMASLLFVAKLIFAYELTPYSNLGSSCERKVQNMNYIFQEIKKLSEPTKTKILNELLRSVKRAEVECKSTDVVNDFAMEGDELFGIKNLQKVIHQIVSGKKQTIEPTSQDFSYLSDAVYLGYDYDKKRAIFQVGTSKASLVFSSPEGLVKHKNEKMKIRLDGISNVLYEVYFQNGTSLNGTNKEDKALLIKGQIVSQNSTLGKIRCDSGIYTNYKTNSEVGRIISSVCKVNDHCVISGIISVDNWLVSISIIKKALGLPTKNISPRVKQKTANQKSKHIVLRGYGEECNIQYDLLTKTVVQSNCVTSVNANKQKEYCTKNKKFCKSEQEIRRIFSGKKQTTVNQTYTSVNPQVSKKTLWEGIWRRADPAGFYGAELEITRVSSSGFYFSIYAMDGSGSDVMHGKSILKYGYATHRNVDRNCDAVFRLIHRCIKVESAKCDAGGYNNSTSFSGIYCKNTPSPKKDAKDHFLQMGIFKNNDGLKAFQKLTGKHYKFFKESLQLASSPKNLDYIKAKVYSWGIKGQDTISQSIVMLGAGGKVYAATIDGNIVIYFTNDSKYKRSLPRTIERWREGFGSKKVFHFFQDSPDDEAEEVDPEILANLQKTVRGWFDFSDSWNAIKEFFGFIKKTLGQLLGEVLQISFPSAMQCSDESVLKTLNQLHAQMRTQAIENPLSNGIGGAVFAAMSPESIIRFEMVRATQYDKSIELRNCAANAIFMVGKKEVSVPIEYTVQLNEQKKDELLITLQGTYLKDLYGAFLPFFMGGKFKK